MTLQPSKIQALLDPYFQGVPLEVCAKIQAYMELLSFWGKKISLTSILKEKDVVRFHFGESIFALSLQRFEHGRLADVGSGAGFPGLAIKLLRPNLKMALLEPNTKKRAFLNEVVRNLEFSEVEVLPTGFEVSEIGPGDLTYITSRALGKAEDLLRWARSTVAHDGRIILWLSADDVAKTMQEPRWYWTKAPIPGTVKREILVGGLRGPEENINP